MAATGYETRNKVACVKCKQRHKPPVGLSCQRVMAIRPKDKSQKTGSLATDTEGLVRDNSQPSTSGVVLQDPQGESSGQTVPKPPKRAKKPTTADVLDKLNAVMEKFGDFEKRLEQQEKKDCNSFSLSTQPSAHSSPKQRTSHHSVLDRSGRQGRKPLPSVDFLKSDSDIQAEVDRRLRHFEDFNRDDTAGMSTKIKSGRYRLGDQRVKHLVHWPHEFCSVGDNFKMPAYEDLNVFQWVQGFSRCIMEEPDQQTRLHMLQYQCSLMQDALELNWPTAKRAHAAVLTEIERGCTSWADQAGVDRIRQRFTQRLIKTQATTSSEEQTKICKRYNEETCNQPKDHVEGRTLYKHACFTCYRAVKRHYPHPEAKCNRAKKQASHPLEKPRV